ncbi:LuxR C-terminal-related transcriptional regulator [Nonomuraea sp. NPDC050790]|uniref:helix-turn-helix transcriptional regulator n=1 Tax=Nonomuraea sp. NPDC050790 TaxID=3364371 RepID=UPI0037985925
MAVEKTKSVPDGGEGENPTPLRGRRDEMGLLTERLAALAGGAGSVVTVEGPPGSGKTRLLEETRAQAARAGLPSGHGSGSRDDLVLPFGPLMEALYAGRRTPGPRAWTSREFRDELAASGPLTVCLDDVRWCDPGTLDALATLPPGPVLWVLAVGPEPAEALRRIRARADDRIVLRPLADDAVAALAADLLQAEPDESVMRVARRAEGGPRLVVELLRGMREEGLVTVTDGVASTAGESLPRRLHAMARNRLDQLSPSARRCLQVVAVLDRPFTAEDVNALTGATPSEIAALTREAIDAGILSRTGDLLTFRRDLFRQAIHEALPAALRRYLRRRAVNVHLAHGGNVADVAAVLAESAVPGDLQAAGLLREAAADLAATAPSAAVALNRRALELARPAGLHTTASVDETVDLLAAEGRFAEAGTLAGTALEGVLTPEAGGRLRLSMARLASHASFLEAARHCRIGQSSPDLPEPLRVRLSAVQALHLAQTGDTAHALAAAQPALGGADDEARATALAALSRVELSRLDLDLAAEYQDRADALAARSRTRHAPWELEGCGRAFLQLAAGQVGDALRDTDEAVRVARRDGHTAAAHLWSMNRARILLDAGLLAACRTEAEDVLAGDLGSGDFADLTARYALGRAAVHLGDREGLRRCAADGARMMEAASFSVRRTGAWLAALAADAMGDTARLAELTGLPGQTGQTGQTGLAGLPGLSGLPGLPGLPGLAGQIGLLGDVSPAGLLGDGPLPGAAPDPADLVVLARLALRAGLPLVAAAAAERAAGLGPGFPLLRGVAAHARGLVDGDPDLLQHAVKLLADTERPLVHASAAEDAGRALGAYGDPAAPELLDTALDLYEEAGAARDAGRVRSRLRLLGVRRPRRSRARSAEGRWGLTAAEVEVALLVAQGATNPQVAEQLSLSSHTVNTHLRHIFTKWDIRSRLELARLVLAYEAA